MNEVSAVGVGGIAAGRQARAGAARAETRPASGRAVRAPDQVEVSEVAKYLNKLRALPAVREDLVSSVREEIARGTYDTPERLDLALDGLIDDLFA